MNAAILHSKLMAIANCTTAPEHERENARRHAERLAAKCDVTLPVDEPVWVTAKLERIRVRDMKNGHLGNTIRYMQSHPRMMASRIDVWPHLLAEAKKRWPETFAIPLPGDVSHEHHTR